MFKQSIVAMILALLGTLLAGTVRGQSSHQQLQIDPAMCNARAIELLPGTQSCNYLLAQDGQVFFEGRPIFSAATASRLGAEALRHVAMVRIFPASPSGRSRYVQMCDRQAPTLCWFQFLFDTQARQLKQSYAGRYGPMQDWVQWTQDERYTVLISRGEGRHQLWLIDNATGKSSEWPSYGRQPDAPGKGYNMWLDPTSFRWVNRQDFSVNGALCKYPPNNCDGMAGHPKRNLVFGITPAGIVLRTSQ